MYTFTVNVSNIDWDVEDDFDEYDYANFDLPTEMTVHIELDDVEFDGDTLPDDSMMRLEEYVSDAISDEVGYCHDGFDFEIVSME